MSNLIESQVAIDALMDEFKCTPTMAIRAKHVIEQLPPAQPERKTGKWLLSVQRDGFEGSECSQCGYHIFNTPLYGHNYCPQCGANMRSKAEE